MVDLYLRDDIRDTGRVQPTLAYQPNPLDPTTLVNWWESVDIKIDAEEGMPPAFQTPNPINDYVSYEAALVHRNPQRNRTNRFYVQVHNRGINPATSVLVRAFFADASMGLPNLPPDFWSAGKPFVGTPGGTAWTSIGPTQTIPSLPAAEPGVLEWDWMVPATAADHSCLLAVATCNEDAINAAGVFDVGALVTGVKQATLKNLHIVDPVAGQAMQAANAMVIRLHNPFREAAQFDVVFRWQNLPLKTRVFVAFEKPPDRKPALFAKPDVLRRNGIVIARGKGRLFPKTVAEPCGAARRMDLSRVYQMSPRKDGSTTLPAVRALGGASLVMVINLILPNGAGKESSQFSVAQQSGGRVLGGSTYLLRSQHA